MDSEIRLFLSLVQFVGLIIIFFLSEGRQEEVGGGIKRHGGAA